MGQRIILHTVGTNFRIQTISASNWLLNRFGLFPYLCNLSSGSTNLTSSLPHTGKLRESSRTRYKWMPFVLYFYSLFSYTERHKSLQLNLTIVKREPESMHEKGQKQVGLLPPGSIWNPNVWLNIQMSQLTLVNTWIQAQFQMVPKLINFTSIISSVAHIRVATVTNSQWQSEIAGGFRPGKVVSMRQDRLGGKK